MRFNLPILLADVTFYFWNTVRPGVNGRFVLLLSWGGGGSQSLAIAVTETSCEYRHGHIAQIRL